MNAIPSQWMILRLILGLAIRRTVHQIFASVAMVNRTSKDFLADRRLHAIGVHRVPTPRKHVKTGLLTVFFIALTVFYMFVLNTMFIGSLALERGLEPTTLYKMSRLQRQFDLECVDTRPYVRTLLYGDPFITNLPPAQQESAIEAISDNWIAGDLDGNGCTLEDPLERLYKLNVNAAYPLQYELLVTFTSLAVLLALIAIIASNLGSIAVKDFGHTDSETLWFISLPIPTFTLFIAKTVVYAIQPEIWLVLFPFMIVCALIGQHGWYSPILALLTCIPIALAQGGIRLNIETSSRMYLKPSLRKNMQIIFSLIGMVLMLYLLYITFKYRGLQLWGSNLAPWSILPSAWPLHAVFTPGMGFWPWWAFSTIFSLAITTAAIAHATYAVRGGFIANFTSSLASQKSQTGQTNLTSQTSPNWPPLSIIGKDLRMLSRDRLFLFNVLMAPILGIGTQLVINPELIDAILHNFRHACTLAYIVAAYMLSPSATTVLSAEGPALWLLIAAPQPLLLLLQQKLQLWTSLALLYTAVAFAFIIILIPWPGSTGIADAIMVVLGVPIFAVIAAGIGAASDDPNAVDPKLRIDTTARQILGMIMLMHGQAIYTTDWHSRLVWLMLCSVFAYALWQRLEERLPWLLDPIDTPPERIDLTHGALAAMTFMVLQGLISLPLTWVEVQPAHIVLIAFSAAGILTAFGFLWSFWRNSLPDILHSTGIMPRGQWHTALWLNLRWGIGGGIVAATLGIFYLIALTYFPLIMSELGITDTNTVPLWLLLTLTVLAAPIAEEFIFRGLLFTGLAATIPIHWAVPASAAAFALIHPSIAVLPVFMMGCIAAIAYHKTNWLLAPMLVHAIYNAAVVLLQFYSP